MATAVNFKDLMKALGVLDPDYLEETYFGSALGMEASGIVSRVGAGVRRFAPGDAVVMGVVDSFSRYVVLPARYAFPKPQALKFTDAVVPFINAMPAYCGLCKKAQLRRGERVLIHSASGGVGLIAIQIARWVGAEIFATAGSEPKRKYLRDLGIEHVSDSRSARFYDDVMRWTDGRGVDVVLNVLAGELQLRSVDALAFDGRFIELGKADILANRALPLGAFDRGLSFHALDFDQITTRQVDRVVEMMGEVLELYERGVLTPIPTRVYPACHARAAFEYMATAQHIGKLVVDMSCRTEVEVVPSRRPLPVHADGWYLVTGGFSELGLQSAEWLLGRGARRLVLVSRSGATLAEQQQRLADWRQRGIEVVEARADLAEARGVQALLEQLPGPLAGVFHLATVYRDAPLERMTRGDVQAVMNAKALGAKLVLDALVHEPPEWFVAFSSVSAFGNQGQANYAAANGYLDELAQAYAGSGVRVISVNLGPVRAGEVARNRQLEGHFSQLGIAPLDPAALFASLERAFHSGVPRVAVLDVSWERFMTAHALSRSSLFREFRPELRQSDASELEQLLAAADASERQRLAERYIIGHLAKVLRMSPEQIGPDSRMDELGVDSLMAVTASNAIEADGGVALGSVRFTQKPTVSRLASDWLRAKLAQGAGRGEREEAAAARQVASAADALLVPLRSSPAPRRRLVCLPGTGADATVYEPWGDALPEDVELIGVNYPGSLRRSRYRPESLEVLAEELASELFMQLGSGSTQAAPQPEPGLVLVGHSLGGNLAYELALELEQLGAAPQALVVLAANPPSVRHTFGKDDMSLNFEYLDRFGLRVDEAVYKNDPNLRADLERGLANTRRLLASYHREPGQVRLQAPMTCVCGSRDRIVKPEEQEAWRAFASEVHRVTLEHEHFLLGNAELLPLVLKMLSTCSQPGRAAQAGEAP